MADVDICHAQTRNGIGQKLNPVVFVQPLIGRSRGDLPYKYTNMAAVPDLGRTGSQPDRSRRPR